MAATDETAVPSSRQSTRCGIVALIGRPNVGKSTLLNALLGQKLSIVSPRPQTTRNTIRGILTTDRTQVVFADTPGMQRRRDPLNRFMNQQALEGMHGVDCVVLVTEVDVAHGPDSCALHQDDRWVLNRIPQQGSNQNSPDLIIVVNKVDRLKSRDVLLPLLERWQAEGYSCLVPMSAKNSDGVDRVLTEIVARMPVGPHLYPPDTLTDRAERFVVAELIREQVFNRCRQELPYAVAVEIEAFEERHSRDDVVIDAVIHVEREGQKAIIIGKKGEMLGAIGAAARQQVGVLLDCLVHLRLRVHVERDWTRFAATRRRFGYD